MVSVVGFVLHDVGEAFFLFHDVHPREQTRFNTLAENDVQLVDIAVNRCPHGDDLLITTSENDSGRRHLLVGGDLFTKGDINRVDDGRVFKFGVHHITVCVKVVAVHVRVLVAVQCRARMEAVRCFPLVRHFVLVGVLKPWRSEVTFSKDLGNLVFLQVVHAVFVPISVAVRCICGVQDVTSVGRHRGIGITEFKTVGHAIAIGIPVRWTVQETISIHVHQEPVSLNSKEGSNVGNRVKQRLVAVFSKSGVKCNGFIGYLNDVVNQIHV